MSEWWYIKYVWEIETAGFDAERWKVAHDAIHCYNKVARSAGFRWSSGNIDIRTGELLSQTLNVGVEDVSSQRLEDNSSKESS